MNRTRPLRPIRRLAGILAALATALLAVTATAAQAAFAVPPPPGPAATTLPPEPPGWYKHPPLPTRHVTGPAYRVHTVAGGTPGWQIALIAIAAAILAAAVAVSLDRARAARLARSSPA
jgi:hypothetical protein